MLNFGFGVQIPLNVTLQYSQVPEDVLTYIIKAGQEVEGDNREKMEVMIDQFAIFFIAGKYFKSIIIELPWLVRWTHKRNFKGNKVYSGIRNTKIMSSPNYAIDHCVQIVYSWAICAPTPISHENSSKYVDTATNCASLDHLGHDLR